MSVLLKISGLSKSFPGVKALDDVDLTLERGSVHALMGENGAGKSTLMKCLFGVYTPDSGEILLDGEKVCFSSPKAAIENGVAMVHQELNQAEKLTAAENMWLGRFPRYGKYLPFLSEGEMRRRTAVLFEELGLNIDPDRAVEELTVSERQMLEIAKAVSYDAKIIVFDEPTSSLTEREAERLFGIINMLRSKGCGIIYISHKMGEILRICDTVTVMRDGKRIATEPKESMTLDRIIKLMVGRELTSFYPNRERNIGEPILIVENLSGEYSVLKNASLMLRRGEILGVAGLEGSGRTELLEAIFGLASVKSGSITLEGKRVKNKNPREAIKNGFALLTEERRRTSIFSVLDILENTTVSSREKIKNGPFLSKRRAERLTERYIKRMRIKTPSTSSKIQNLSGGNQQKVIIARWLLTEPLILLLDEPTRGIDVLAKYEIYSILAELANEGRGIIFVSSEMPELLGTTDRIIVMSGGRVAGEVDTKAATQEKIMELAARFAE